MIKKPMTPGPWKTASGYGYTAIRSEDLVIANMRYVDGSTNEANARLLAASPDLLQELKRLIDHVGHYASMQHSHPQAAQHVANARSLVIEIEGGEPSRSYQREINPITS